MCGKARGSDEYGTTTLYRILYELFRILWGSVGGSDFDFPGDLELV
jgi:hypothetical protein